MRRRLDKAPIKQPEKKPKQIDSVHFLPSLQDLEDPEIAAEYAENIRQAGIDIRTMIQRTIAEQPITEDSKWDLMEYVEAKVKELNDLKNKLNMHATKEALIAIRATAEAVDQAHQIYSSLDRDKPEPKEPFGYVLEAKEISKGGLFTHVAPEDYIEKVLSSGALISIIESERKRNLDRSRQHTKSGSKEKHQVCFERDNIYHNFHGGQEVAFIFSENQLLAQGFQYFKSDGIHLLDPKYDSSSKTCPGLLLDLKTVPFMLMVPESKREKIIELLKTKSFLSAELSQLTDEEFDVWLDENVIFVEELGIRQDDITKFHTQKQIRPQPGFVMDTKNSKYAGDNEPEEHQLTRKFTPFKK